MIFSLLLLIIVFSIDWSFCLKCYECTGYIPCGNGQTNLMINCPGKCMVYQNQFDGGMIIRRCCWNNCGEDGLSIYEGRLTYFCSEDICNGDTSDQYLIQGGTQQPIEGSGDQQQTTIQLPSISSTKTTVTLSTILSSSLSSLLSSSSSSSSSLSSSSSSSLLSCHECTGHYSLCGMSEHTIIHNCRMCMVYRNVYDGNTIVRRCCYSGCGTANSVSTYEGRQAYFCSSNLCNGIGSENVLP